MSVLPPQHQRVGAHRARRNPIAATATAAAAAVALTAILLWGLSTTFFGGSGDAAQAEGSGVGDAATVPSTAAIEVPAETASAAPSVAPSVPPPPPTTTAPPPPVVDQAASVLVLNGGVNVPGVARGTAENLVAAGWTGVDPAQTANAPEFPNAPTTTVYYADPALQATADALVAALGAGVAQQGDLAAYGGTSQLVVVMGADFPVP